MVTWWFAASGEKAKTGCGKTMCIYFIATTLLTTQRESIEDEDMVHSGR